MRKCVTCAEPKGAGKFARRSEARGGAASRECKACANKRSAAWRANNPARASALVAKWRAENSEQRRTVDALWVVSNPAKVAVTKLRWKRKHPDKVARDAMRYYAIKVGAIPAWTNHIAVGEFYSLAAVKTRLTGEPYHVDHRVPLRSKLVCGLHTHYNLQVMRGVDNIRKGNRYWPDMPEAAHG